MAQPGLRLQRLQQIPVFALRQPVYVLIENRQTEALMRQRFRAILKITPRQLKRAVQRLTREQLTKLINACPEISDDQIKELFEEYRYGTNPSFYIYLFDPSRLTRSITKAFRPRFDKQVEAFNTARHEGLPPVRRLALNDVSPLPGQREILEGNYRFQSRLDYIDEDENAISIYETLYGFFWLHTRDGYAIIHARHNDVLKGLKQAIEAGAQVYLTALVIPKSLKNALPFLSRDLLRSSKLHDPDPGPEHFRWLTIADDDPYARNYERYEQIYPEVRSARYREVVNDEKVTSLTIRCDQGALSLAGKFKASQFRAWCLNHLEQLITALNQFKANAPAYVQTRKLENTPEMAKFNARQKQHVLNIISGLLTSKQPSNLNIQSLRVSPLELAADMGRFVRVQIPFECPEPGCDEEAYLACEVCGASTLTLQRQDAVWRFVCRRNGRLHWNSLPPLKGCCDRGHAFSLAADDLADMIELLPTDDLLQTIADVVNHHLPGYFFDAKREGFIVRGTNLLYYPDKKGVLGDQHGNKYFSITQNIGSVAEGATVTGVQVGQHRSGTARRTKPGRDALVHD